MKTMWTSYIAAVALLICAGPARGEDSFLDSSFNPGAGAEGGLVETVVLQPDGKILICGNFASIGGISRAFIARLNDDGSVDTSFEAHPGYWVRQMALQADGKIVIGGFFTNVEGVPRNLVARLNSDGSLDPSFDPGLGAQTKIVEGDDKAPFVFAVAVQPDGKILIAGNFRTYNGTPRSGIARLNADGSLDTDFVVGAGFDSWGRFLMVLPNDQVLATGWFTSYNNKPFNRMVRLNDDGSADESFRPSFGDKTAIYGAALLPDGKMIAVGHSINEQGLFRQDIARLNPDGSFDATFAGFLNDRVESVYLQADGKILVGGYFSLANGVPRNGLARLNVDGTLDESFKAETDNFVWTICGQPDGKVLVCGGFSTIDKVSRRGIARLVTREGVPMPRLQQPSFERGQFRVMTPTAAGRDYVLQFRQLPSSRWNSRPPIAGDGTMKRLVDPEAWSSGNRIYRVLVN